jgi:hypothetical protein
LLRNDSRSSDPTSWEAGEEPQVMGAKTQGMNPPPVRRILAHHDHIYCNHLASFEINPMWEVGEKPQVMMGAAG